MHRGEFMAARCSIQAIAGAVVSVVVAMACTATQAQELSAQEVFKRVSPSVVVIEVRDYPKGKPVRLVASGSGVVIPNRDTNETLIATNCHLTDKSDIGAFLVRHGESTGLGYMHGKDAARDLCLIGALFPADVGKDGKVAYKKLPAARVASSQWIEVGDPVYAIGAPQGLELTLSNGLVSGIRKYKDTDYIQTTAPISQGSSGGGLFDAQGRLVGITTMFLKDGQNLNFAVPAELIASVPLVKVESDSAEADAAAAAAETAAAAADAAVSAETARNKRRDRWLTTFQDSAVTMAFDTQTIVRDGRNVTVWERSRYKEPQRLGPGEFYIEKVSRVTFYCGKRQWSFDQVVVRDLDGKSVGSAQWEPREIESRDVVPESAGEFSYKAACNEL